jgi:hypothetical protein
MKQIPPGSYSAKLKTSDPAAVRFVTVEVSNEKTHWVTREYKKDGTSTLINFGHQIHPKPTNP